MERWRQIIGFSILGGITLGIFIDLYLSPVVETAQAETVATTAEVVVKVRPEWNDESISQYIREQFPENPKVAVAIARCESGLVPDIQSGHTLSYGREQSFGIFQIHAKDWDAKAKRMNLGNYKTDVEENVAMARYLYKARGNFRDWSCYNNGGYKRYL